MKRSSKKTHRPASRSTVAPLAPDSSLVKKAKHLPLFGPGIEISVPLHLWPAYRELHHLEVLGPKQIAWLREHGVRKKDGVVYVRRVPPTEETRNP